MVPLPRILLVQDMSSDWKAALFPLADNRLLDQTWVVRDGEEAMDFLHARGGFERRPPGLPAVVLLGADLPPTKSLQTLEQIRRTPQLSRVPIVMLTHSSDPKVWRRAYELGVNGVVPTKSDQEEYAECLSATWVFWALTNVAPPGCLRFPNFEDRERQ